MDVLPTWVRHRSHLSLISRYLDGLPAWSTISRLHQLLAFGCLARKDPPKITFINNFSPKLLDLHGSTLGDLFNCEDGGHVVIATNLNKNAYDLNMKVADFKRTNMLALPPI